jgi:hypothetical protein
MFAEDVVDPQPASEGSSFLVDNRKAVYAKRHQL